ncbi:MAG: BamA/TamA family outer membrane protein [Desulfobulbaceae bacterium]|nr:BamA/TamA family outer membrane protein [Desulfobulbaceae bacterium]
MTAYKPISYLRTTSIIISILLIYMIIVNGIFINVVMGLDKGLEITIIGNTGLTVAQLKKAAERELQDLAVADGPGKDLIDDAAFRMETLYRRAGYPHGVVDYRIIERQGSRTIEFIVEEGPRVLVTSLNIQGAKTISVELLTAGAPESIKVYLKDKKPFPHVVSEIEALREEIFNVYLAKGYLDVVVEQESKLQEDVGEVAVVVRISEGRRYTLGKLLFSGDQPEELKKPLRDLRASMVGKPYHDRQKLLVRSAVLELYANAGYPDVSALVEAEKKSDTATVELGLRITSGPLVYIDGVKMQGSTQTVHSFVADRMTLKKGDLFRLDEKYKSLGNLYRTDLFSRVDIELAPAGEDPGHRILNVHLTEMETLEIFVEPGWGSYEMFRLAGGLRKRNFLGRGMVLGFKGLASVMGSSAELSFTDPWLAEGALSMEIPFNYLLRKEPSYTLESIGTGLNFLMTGPLDTTISSGYHYDKNEVFDVKTETGNDSYGKGSINLQLSRDTRDDLFFPRSGVRSVIGLEVAERSLGGNLAFYRCRGNISLFQEMAGNIILGLRYGGGFILPGNEQDGIPLTERYFNGGANSVRSFRESRLGVKGAGGDPLGGTGFNIITLELRRKVTTNMALSLFFDYGNIAPNQSIKEDPDSLLSGNTSLIAATWEDYFKDFRSAVGVGVQYLTPVGPARLDIALNPAPDRERDEAQYAVHFSVGMAF